MHVWSWMYKPPRAIVTPTCMNTNATRELLDAHIIDALSCKVQTAITLLLDVAIDWIGCGLEHIIDTHRGLIELDWVSKFVDWVGLYLAKWTHVQPCMSSSYNRYHFFATWIFKKFCKPVTRWSQTAKMALFDLLNMSGTLGFGTWEFHGCVITKSVILF